MLVLETLNFRPEKILLNTVPCQKALDLVSWQQINKEVYRILSRQNSLSVDQDVEEQLESLVDVFIIEELQNAIW